MNEYDKKVLKVILGQNREAGSFVTDPVHDPYLFKMQMLKQWEKPIGFNCFPTSLQEFWLMIKFLLFFPGDGRLLGWKLEQSVCIMPTFRSKELDTSDFWKLCGMQLPHTVICNGCKRLVYFMNWPNITIWNTRNLTGCFAFVFHIIIQN